MSDWQPIETAPRDGRIILAYGETLPTFICPLKWGGDMWSICCQNEAFRFYSNANPTHWMDMPPAPLQATKTVPEACDCAARGCETDEFGRFWYSSAADSYFRCSASVN